MNIGEQYKFHSQSEILIYLGKNYSSNGYWHQFRKVGESIVWCELLDDDLCLLEKVSVK